MIDGSADYFDPTLFDKVEVMIAKYENDPEMMALIDKAAVAYSEAADRLTS